MVEHIIGPAHVAIYTKDIEKSIAFYEALGGVVECRSDRQIPEGVKRLALLNFGGMMLEITQCPFEMPFSEGVVAHFAVYVDDVEAAAKAIKDSGVETSFVTPQKRTLPDLFGGYHVWLFRGPSGEQIEMMEKI